MKGIILAGGSGTRLYPLTQVVSKQLLPVYDKPMIHYPLSVLMLAGIREILIITTPHDSLLFQELLGDGSQLGLEISYIVQPEPKGLPQAFTLGKEFIGSDSVCLILGDNIFYGPNLPAMLQQAASLDSGGRIFAYPVKDPERYGVVEFDDEERAVSVEEKPEHPQSRYAITGLYFFDNRVVDVAENLIPSKRGETEIVDVIRWYLDRKELHVTALSRGFAWLDTGTHESLHDAASFVATIQNRQGLKISCLEEIAFRKGLIDLATLNEHAAAYNNAYGAYLNEVRQADIHFSAYKPD